MDFDRTSEVPGAHEVEARHTPKSFTAFVVGADTPVSSIIEIQRNHIVTMLDSDPTGRGKVVVVVDNPLSSAISNELTTEFPGRIQVQAHVVTSEVHQWMSMMNAAGNTPHAPLREGIEGRSQTEVIDSKTAYYNALGEHLRARDAQTARQVETALAKPDVLGGVAVFTITEVGISGALENAKDAKGVRKWDVATQFDDTLSMRPTDVLVVKALEGTLTYRDVEAALQKEIVADQAITKEVDKLEVTIYQAHSEYNQIKADLFYDLAITLAGEGGEMLESDIQEPSSDERVQSIRERVQSQAPGLAEAFLRHYLKVDPTQAQIAAGTEGLTELLIRTQAHWDQEIIKLTERYLKSFDHPTEDQIRTYREVAVDQLRGSIANTTETEVPDINTISTALLTAQWYDPDGVVRRAEGEAKFLPDVDFGNLDPYALERALGLDVAEIPDFGEQDRSGYGEEV